MVSTKSAFKQENCGYGGVCIFAKSALNWPDNAPICCSHSNAMVSYREGMQQQQVASAVVLSMMPDMPCIVTTCNTLKISICISICKYICIYSTWKSL